MLFSWFLWPRQRFQFFQLNLEFRQNCSSHCSTITKTQQSEVYFAIYGNTKETVQSFRLILIGFSQIISNNSIIFQFYENSSHSRTRFRLCLKIHILKNPRILMGSCSLFKLFLPFLFLSKVNYESKQYWL